MATLGWLASFAALGLAGYLLWRVEYANPNDGVETRFNAEVARLDGDIRRSRSASEAELGARIARLEEAMAAQREALAAAETALAEAIAKQQREGAPSSREWKIAEAEYLLRIANHRLLMERDVDAASGLLEAADVILEELDDYSLHQVRAQLADERLALANSSGANTQSVFLRLEAIKNALRSLPLKLPEYIGAPPVDETQIEANEEASAWRLFLDKVSGLFEFRIHDGIAVRPLLKPEEAIYLELNLRLALERAQLAALRRDQVLYQTSLEAAQGWLEEYLDPENEAVSNVGSEIARLLLFDLEMPVPDISGSLMRLLELDTIPEETNP